MSKEKLFEYYLLKNPSLVNQMAGGRVVMSANGFKKFFETTYDVAYKEGVYHESNKQESDVIKNLFNIFKMN